LTLRLLFTPSARSQFLSAIQYILEDNPRAAVKFRLKVEAILRRLLRFPHSGRRIPEFPTLPFREVVIAPYRFFYRVESNTIWVVAAWHSAQLPSSPHETEGA
jgi:plasmid stabilization system protein ParE